MRYFLICDRNDTLIGMRLSGIYGIITYGKAETEEKIAQALRDESIAVLLITEKLAALCPETVNRLRLESTRPLLVVIPDRYGTKRPADSITSYIREAIGIKL